MVPKMALFKWIVMLLIFLICMTLILNNSLAIFNELVGQNYHVIEMKYQLIHSQFSVSPRRTQIWFRIRKTSSSISLQRRHANFRQGAMGRLATVRGSQLDCWPNVRVVGPKCTIATIRTFISWAQSERQSFASIGCK